MYKAKVVKLNVKPHPFVAHYRERTIVEFANRAKLTCKFLGIAHPKGQRWVLLTKQNA